MSKYFGSWANYASMVDDFSRYCSVEETPHDMAKEEEILLAAYEHEGYEGSAMVLFEREGQLFEVSGGHCSCYGLEGQWKPQAISWKALAMRPEKTWGARSIAGVQRAFVALVAAHT